MLRALAGVVLGAAALCMFPPLSSAAQAPAPGHGMVFRDDENQVELRLPAPYWEMKTPEEMAGQLEALLSAGASFVGGCCGTNPATIKAFRAQLEEK